MGVAFAQLAIDPNTRWVCQKCACFVRPWWIRTPTVEFPAEDRSIICTILFLLDVSKGMFQVAIPLILW